MFVFDLMSNTNYYINSKNKIMAKKIDKSNEPNAFYNLFNTGEELILTEKGFLILAPVPCNNLSGIKTVASLPDNIEIKKNEIIFEKVLFNHHPTFKLKENQLLAKKLGYDIFDVERLCEEACAAVGGYNFIDVSGQDYDDIENSDMKTASVNVNSGVATISSIHAKVGTLRIVVYNPIVQDVHFFYLTFEQWKYMSTECYGKDAGKQRLRLQYSNIEGTYNHFEKYRVADFTTLATKMTLKPGWNIEVQDQCLSV